jgi:hypothetical protein
MLLRMLVAAFAIVTLAMAWASLRTLRRRARHYRQFSRAALSRCAELEEQAHRGIIVCEAKGPVRAGAMVAVAEQGKPS